MAWIAGAIAVGGALLSDSMQDTPSVPGASPEERELMGLQADLLRDAIASRNSANDLNRMLMPILLQESGFDVTRATENVINPKYTKARDRYDKVHDFVMKNQQYFARDENGNLRLSRKGRGEDGGPFDLKSHLNGIFKDLMGDPASLGIAKDDLKKLTKGKDGVEALQNIVKEFNSAHTELVDTQRYSQRRGDITDITRIIDPQDQLREDNETLLLQRQNAALRGELPVNPALLSSLDDQEEQLRTHLMDNLGTGYETSTPGIEALDKFGKTKQEILEAARRDDMSTAGQLALGLGQFNEGLTTNTVNRLGGISSLIGGNSTDLANLSSSFNGPLQLFQNNRNMQFEAGLANSSPSALQSMLYSGAGAAQSYALASLFEV